MDLASADPLGLCSPKQTHTSSVADSTLALWQTAHSLCGVQWLSRIDLIPAHRPSTYFKTQAKRLVEAGAIPWDANPKPAAVVSEQDGAGSSVAGDTDGHVGGTCGGGTDADAFLDRFAAEWERVGKDPAAWYTPPMMATVLARKR